MKKILIALISVALVGSAFAESPKASEQRKSKPAKKSHGTVLQSHSKQVGNIGPFQVHSIRLRGLDSPNVTAAVLFDTRNESITVIGPATGAGLGSAILGAAGNVGSAAVFGASLRPTRINENIDNSSESESESEGGDAVSVSKSQGGSAVSISDADAKSSVRNENSNSSVNVNSNQQSQNQSSVNNNSSKNHNHNKAPKAPKKSRKH